MGLPGCQRILTGYPGTAASTLTAGCGMCVLVDADGKPIVTPMN